MVRVQHSYDSEGYHWLQHVRYFLCPTEVLKCRRLWIGYSTVIVSQLGGISVHVWNVFPLMMSDSSKLPIYLMMR